MALVSLTNVTKTYPAADRGGAPVVAVDDVSLDIEAGDVYGIIGYSGAGTPSEDALVLEQAEGNPNANLLVTLPGEANDPRVKKLAELLTSPEVKQFIDENYTGAVLAAF